MGNIDIIDQQIEENMGLIISIVNRFCPRNEEERERFIQAGRIGLWKAIKNLIPSKGKLTTIAFRNITWEILKEINFINKNRKTVSSNNIKITKPAQDLLWEYFSNTLTDNELKILQMRVEGYTLQQIATCLNFKSSKLYKMYIGTIRKLNAKEKNSICNRS